MAITVNSSSASSGQPSAPLRLVTINVDLDASYPAGGYDVNAQIGQNETVVGQFFQSFFAAATLRWYKVNSFGFVQAFANNSGAPGAEVAGSTDLSATTGLELTAVVQ